MTPVDAPRDLDLHLVPGRGLSRSGGALLGHGDVLLRGGGLGGPPRDVPARRFGGLCAPRLGLVGRLGEPVAAGRRTIVLATGRGRREGRERERDGGEQGGGAAQGAGTVDGAARRRHKRSSCLGDQAGTGAGAPGAGGRRRCRGHSTAVMSTAAPAKR
ncbi:MAG: hypothetical protein KY433_03540, partial [Actinobacteria bacterium]|nr:hypothetical protein [Actinomycetota bacterium]